MQTPYTSKLKSVVPVLRLAFPVAGFRLCANHAVNNYYWYFIFIVSITFRMDGIYENARDSFIYIFGPLVYHWPIIEMSRICDLLHSWGSYH